MTNRVCRFCLISTNNFYSLRNIQDVPVKAMLKFLVPELYLSLSTNPVICNQCFNSLRDAYNFRRQCLRSENLIATYIRETHCPTVTIRLQDVVDYWKEVYTSKSYHSEIARTNLFQWFSMKDVVKPNEVGASKIQSVLEAPEKNLTQTDTSKDHEGKFEETVSHVNKKLKNNQDKCETNNQTIIERPELIAESNKNEVATVTESNEKSIEDLILASRMAPTCRKHLTNIGDEGFQAREEFLNQALNENIDIIMKDITKKKPTVVEANKQKPLKLVHSPTNPVPSTFEPLSDSSSLSKKTIKWPLIKLVANDNTEDIGLKNIIKSLQHSEEFKKFVFKDNMESNNSQPEVSFVLKKVYDLTSNSEGYSVTPKLLHDSKQLPKISFMVKCNNLQENNKSVSSEPSKEINLEKLSKTETEGVNKDEESTGLISLSPTPPERTTKEMPRIRVRPVSSLQKVRTLNHELFPQTSYLPTSNQELNAIKNLPKLRKVSKLYLDPPPLVLNSLIERGSSPPLEINKAKICNLKRTYGKIPITPGLVPPIEKHLDSLIERGSLPPLEINKAKIWDLKRTYCKIPITPGLVPPTEKHLEKMSIDSNIMKQTKKLPINTVSKDAGINDDIEKSIEKELLEAYKDGHNQIELLREESDDDYLEHGQQDDTTKKKNYLSIKDKDLSLKNHTGSYKEGHNQIEASVAEEDFLVDKQEADILRRVENNSNLVEDIENDDDLREKNDNHFLEERKKNDTVKEENDNTLMKGQKKIVLKMTCGDNEKNNTYLQGNDDNFTQDRQAYEENDKHLMEERQENNSFREHNVDTFMEHSQEDNTFRESNDDTFLKDGQKNGTFREANTDSFMENRQEFDINIKNEPLDIVEDDLIDELEKIYKSPPHSGETTRSASETSLMGSIIEDMDRSTKPHMETTCSASEISMLANDNLPNNLLDISEIGTIAEPYDEPEYIEIDNIPFSDLAKIAKGTKQQQKEFLEEYNSEIPISKKVKKRFRLVPIDIEDEQVETHKKKRLKEQSNPVPKLPTVIQSEHDVAYSMLYTSISSAGDYINDHDYLISPYKRNWMTFVRRSTPNCCCLLCDAVHPVDEHLQHMQCHGTRCNICNVDFCNVFILNMHVRKHIYFCEECRINVRYSHHAMIHNKSIYSSNIDFNKSFQPVVHHRKTQIVTRSRKCKENGNEGFCDDSDMCLDGKQKLLDKISTEGHQTESSETSKTVKGFVNLNDLLNSPNNTNINVNVSYVETLLNTADPQSSISPISKTIENTPIVYKPKYLENYKCHKEDDISEKNKFVTENSSKLEENVETRLDENCPKEATNPTCFSNRPADSIADTTTENVEDDLSGGLSPLTDNPKDIIVKELAVELPAFDGSLNLLTSPNLDYHKNDPIKESTIKRRDSISEAKCSSNQISESDNLVVKKRRSTRKPGKFATGITLNVTNSLQQKRYPGTQRSAESRSHALQKYPDSPNKKSSVEQEFSHLENSLNVTKPSSSDNYEEKNLATKSPESVPKSSSDIVPLRIDDNSEVITEKTENDKVLSGRVEKLCNKELIVNINWLDYNLVSSQTVSKKLKNIRIKTKRQQIRKRKLQVKKAKSFKQKKSLQTNEPQVKLEPDDSMPNESISQDMEIEENNKKVGLNEIKKEGKKRKSNVSEQEVNNTKSIVKNPFSERRSSRSHSSFNLVEGLKTYSPLRSRKSKKPIINYDSLYTKPETLKSDSLTPSEISVSDSTDNCESNLPISSPFVKDTESSLLARTRNLRKNAKTDICYLKTLTFEPVTVNTSSQVSKTESVVKNTDESNLQILKPLAKVTKTRGRPRKSHKPIKTKKLKTLISETVQSESSQLEIPTTDPLTADMSVSGPYITNTGRSESKLEILVPLAKDTKSSLLVSPKKYQKPIKTEKSLTYKSPKLKISQLDTPSPVLSINTPSEILLSDSLAKDTESSLPARSRRARKPVKTYKKLETIASKSPNQDSQLTSSNVLVSHPLIKDTESSLRVKSRKSHKPPKICGKVQTLISDFPNLKINTPTEVSVSESFIKERETSEPNSKIIESTNASPVKENANV